MPHHAMQSESDSDDQRDPPRESDWHMLGELLTTPHPVHRRNFPS